MTASPRFRSRRSLATISGVAFILILLTAPRSPRAAESASGGVLLEAEGWDRRSPDDGSFAHSHREGSASGRQVLTRFHVEGEAHYRFSLPEAGDYRLWIRYACRSDVRLRYWIDPAGGGPEWAKLPASGGLDGPDVWRWAPAWNGELEKGAHLLKVLTAALRPDCFYLSPSDEKPGDDILRTKPVVRIDPEQKPLLERPVSPVRPGWVGGAADYRLPRWYEAHRVHLHTRLSLPYRERTPEVFRTAGKRFREMGARVFVRHLKAAGEGAWWPTEHGQRDPRTTDHENLGQFLIDEAHANDCRLIAYYRHMEDYRLANEHPGWVSRRWTGETYEARGPKLCFNSPYADFVEKRLLELVDLGADGIYFDEVHMEKAGCWCYHCREQFRDATGLEFPERPDPFDPVWLKLAEFTNASMERTFRQWRRAVHERDPDVVLLIGSHSWPSMAERHMTHRLFRIADSVKTEFVTGARDWPSAIFPVPESLAPLDRETRISLGYALSRDSADGRPPHVWVNDLPGSEAARFAAAGVMAHGCIANLDVPEATIPNPDFEPALALGETVSSALAETRPVPWALLHYPETARDRFLYEPEKAWTELLYPFYRAYASLRRAGLPVAVVTDSRLAEGVPAECELLFLPGPDALTPAMEKSVAAFEERGGTVVAGEPGWRWGEVRDGPPDPEFHAAVDPLADSAPVRVTGGPEYLHAGVFRPRRGTGRDGAGREDELVVTLAHRFGWVHDAIHAAKENEEASAPDAPVPCRDVRLHLSERPAGEIVEVVSGRILDPERAEGGWVVPVPEFNPMAVVRIRAAGEDEE